MLSQIHLRQSAAWRHTNSVNTCSCTQLHAVVPMGTALLLLPLLLGRLSAARGPPRHLLLSRYTPLLAHCMIPQPTSGGRSQLCHMKADAAAAGARLPVAVQACLTHAHTPQHCCCPCYMPMLSFRPSANPHRHSHLFIWMGHHTTTKQACCFLCWTACNKHSWHALHNTGQRVLFVISTNITIIIVDISENNY